MPITEASDTLQVLLPNRAGEDLGGFYKHVAELFHSQSHERQTLHFATLASAENTGTSQSEALGLAFQAAISLGLYERAYNLLVAMPRSEK